MRKSSITCFIKKVINKIEKEIKNIYLFLTDKDFRVFCKKRLEYRERKVNGGTKNPDKIFYIIRSFLPMGRFSECIYCIKELNYCEKKGYIPVITFAMLSSKKRNLNDWELFFEQPGGYSLKEVLESKTIILGNAFNQPQKTPGLDWLSYNMNTDAKKWFPYFNKYYRYNFAMETYIEKEKKRIWPEKGKVLGVAIRRGILRAIALGYGVTNNHPIDYSLEKMIELVEEKILEWNYDYVFATSDDAEAIEILKEKFENKLLYVKRAREHYYIDGKPNPDDSTSYSNEGEVVREKTYILEMELLSQCNSLISGRNGGTIYANIMNNGKYEHVIVAEKGINHIESAKEKFFNGRLVETNRNGQ